MAPEQLTWLLCSMGVRTGGDKTGICPPPWELRLCTNFFRKHEVRKSIPINWFNFAASIYLPVWHWQCTRFSFIHFTVSEFAVRSCPLLCVTTLGSGFICCWSLLRNNYDSRHFAAFDYYMQTSCLAGNAATQQLSVLPLSVPSRVLNCVVPTDHSRSEIPFSRTCNQARNQLGTVRGAKSFLRGPQIF